MRQHQVGTIKSVLHSSSGRCKRHLLKSQVGCTSILDPNLAVLRAAVVTRGWHGQGIPIQHVPCQIRVCSLANVLLDDPVSVYVRLHQEPTWVKLPGLELARLNQIMLQMERDAKTVEGCTRSTPAPEETLLGSKIE